MARALDQAVQRRAGHDEFRYNTIREKYGFYHAQVFLLNESGDQAELRASTGDVGYPLLSRRHQLTVGSQSVVGQAVLRGVPVLVANTEDEVVFFRNELLPNTHAEFTIPLKDRSKVIGALDIQSTVPFSFTDVDRQALEVIAEALSTSLRDRRLGAEQSVLSAENQRLAKEVPTLQRDNDRLNREVTQGQWSAYLTEHTELTGITLRRGPTTRPRERPACSRRPRSSPSPPSAASRPSTRSRR